MTAVGRLTRLGAGVLAGVVVLLLGACTGIPREGPVVPGRPAGKAPNVGLYQLIADGPVPGSTPDRIVLDFVRAAGGFGDDHRVARSFLAPERRLAWKPGVSVDVYPSSVEPEPKVQAESPTPTAAADGPGESPSPSPGTATPSVDPASAPTADPGRDSRDPSGSATVALDVQIEASVDGNGRYTVQPPSARKKVTYGLTRVGGQWRIDNLPDGILISSFDFAVTFRPYPVYFPDTGQHFLVPDIYWFPSTNVNAIPTALVRALLAGPSPWLAPAVTTGVPTGTRMAVNAVVVSAMTATVDLTDRARSATPPQRRMLALQLRETLSQYSQAVKITVQGADYGIPTGAVDDPTGERSTGPRVDPSVDPRPVVLNSAGKLARVDGIRLVPIPGVDRLAVPGASRPAVSSDGTAYAVLGAQRQSLLMQLPGTPEATTVLQGQQQLTAPSFDPQGWVWTSPAANRGVLYAARTDTGVATVSAPWLAGYDVVSVRASRDGARLLVAARRSDPRRGNYAVAFVAAVKRQQDGRPAEVAPPLSLVPDLTAVTDAAWVDEGQVVVLGRLSGRPQQPLVVRVGGEIRPETAAPGATSITAGNGALTLIAGSPNGLLTRVGESWETTPGARWPAFAG